MSTTMKSTIKVEIEGAGTLSAIHSIDVHAFDKIEISVPAESGGTPGSAVVDVQPGGAGRVKLLLITASQYSNESKELSYSVTGGTSDILLDAPQLLVGDGALKLLGTTQNVFTFSNEFSSATKVQILTGRNAVAP